jgi:hypothetical protein
VEWAAIIVATLMAGALALVRRCWQVVGTSPMIELVVDPAGMAGLFIGRIGDEVIVRSRQPFLDSARVLLARG